MNTKIIIEILKEVESGRITAGTAILSLVAHGMTQHSAEERVFVVLGGDDLVEVGADGKERYRRSQRLVSEVSNLMKK